MELYHFLFSSTFVYFFSFKILFITMFCGLMCNHLHKKYIINYEIKGQYKMLTKTCNYPVNIYNKLTSYNYNNTLCLMAFTSYNKLNYYYLIILDEILSMGTELLLDTFTQLMSKTSNPSKTQNIVTKNNDIELINTMFNGMIKMMPQNKVTKNTNLLNMLKKENKLQISTLKNNELIDDSDNESENLKLQYNLDNLNECQLNSLKDNLGSIKKELQQNIDKLSI